MVDREDKFWESVHLLDKRVVKVETELDTLKSMHNESSEKHAELEEQFKLTFEQLTNALAGIDKKMDVFIARIDSTSQLKEKIWGWGIAIAGLLVGGLGYLISFWVEHVAK